MSKPLLTSRKALAAVVGVLLLNALLPIGYAKWVGKLPTSITQTLAVPVSHPLSWASHQMRPEDRGRAQDMTEAEWIQEKEEYERLNRELWAINRDLRESLETFRALALVIDLKEIKPVEAAVINFNNDRNNPVMRISQGTRVGIKGKDPVVFRTNLLGLVENDPGTLNCKVELVSRPGFRIRVAMEPAGIEDDRDPIIDYAQTHESGQYFIVQHEKGHGLEPGHIAWVNDDLHELARGFLLGRIVEIKPDPDNPHTLDQIIIRPDVPIGPQARVMVITEREE